MNEAQIFGEVELLLSGKTLVEVVAGTDVVRRGGGGRG